MYMRNAEVLLAIFLILLRNYIFQYLRINFCSRTNSVLLRMNLILHPTLRRASVLNKLWMRVYLKPLKYSNYKEKCKCFFTNIM